MKKIEAIIRKTNFDDVKEALHKAGIEFFTFWDVRGKGNAHEGRIYRGAIGASTTLFLGLKYLNGLRVEKRIEEEGLDIYEHGESAYNS